MLIANILDLIGRTPVIRLKHEPSFAQAGFPNFGATGRLVRLLLALLPAVVSASPLVFESQTGPPTPREIAGFKTWLNEFRPDPNNENNAWAFGHSGQAIVAAGFLYETTGDIAFLNRMIALAGTGLATRNDLAPTPVGHRPLWPGESTPAWGNEPAGSPGASHAGPETADVAGRIAYCAWLILKTPALADRIVPDGDPFRFGATYAGRARNFVRLLDATADGFVVPWFVRQTDHSHYYYPKDRRYVRSLPGPDNSGDPIPWNQQFMINHCLQRLAQCHELLQDDPARVAFYDACVSASIAWFLDHTESHPGSKAHGVYYTWHYSLDDSKHVEDVVHAGLDLEGLYRAYLSGRYGAVLSRAHLQAFANDVVDVLPLGLNRWAGMVDGENKSGHAAMTDFPRPALLLMLEFRPDAFGFFANAAMTAKRTAGDPTAIAHLLWVRYRLSPTGGPAGGGSPATTSIEK